MLLLVPCAVLLSSGVAGCGGGGTKSTAKSTPASTAPAPTSNGGGATVTNGPVRGTLTAANHAPTVNQQWPYSVHVTDAAGHPESGTVDIEFTYSGQVVGHDTPPTHQLTNGTWKDNLKFPPTSVGQPLSVQAVAHTPSGSITLDWPVSVHK